MNSLKLSDPALLRNQCLIDGVFVGDPADPVEDPATGEVIALVPRFGSGETASAISAARKAFAGWAESTCKERSAVLRQWYELIGAYRDDLARVLTAEQGKPLAEALGEIDYAASYVEFYAEEAKRIAGEILPSHRRDARILVARQPVGVVAAITPWNFPAAMITRKVAPALAAGCTVVVKPAPETPLTALALAELAQRAGFPAGTLNVITGDARAIGSELTGHRAVRLVSFTGSTEVGKLLMQQCAGTVKKVALELGGNAPFIVFPDADLDAAIEGAMVSKFRNMGQTCVCTNRFYVHEDVYDVFVERLAAAVRELTVGPGTEEGVAQGPLINSAAVAKAERHLMDALSKGGRLVTGGKRHPRGRTFFEPTVLADASDAMELAQEETFGPVAAVFRFQTEDEVIARANDTAFGLAAYFFTKDVGRVFRVTERLEYGMVGINSGLISTELAPFGGVKESGNSREGSHHGIDEFLEKKYALIAGVVGQ
ncbi:NAD-dependent succinate-semialdehyde dehydrogenase [Nitratireductor sp. GCM10026969]|uniref:NAD-dependent succinate-semialdehyde dehydrogenase n=1 Tax=Nitratireductor sp. GCM10026969 TaxID=3252645 RepID=UPI00361EBC5F